MANINKIKLSGTTYSIQDENATKTVELTQAQYDALTVKDPNTFYIITDSQGADLSNYYTKSETSGATEISTALNAKQDTLVSGTNIKTINNESILGSGNIEIEGGGGGKAIEAGTNISVTTGETADTINCTLPITISNSDNGSKQSIAIGSGSSAHISNWYDSIAIGKNSKGYFGSIVIGSNPTAYTQGNGSNVAIGNGTKFYDNSIIIGNYAQGYNGFNANNVAIGVNARANNIKGAVAIGYDVYTDGTTKTNINNQIKIDSSNQVYIYNKDNTEMICLQDQLGGGGSSYTAGDGINITNDVISVTGKVDTTAFTEHTADTVIHVTSAEKAAWDAKSNFSGSYNDLTDKPTIPTVPTSNTAFTNDAGYITSDAISGKADTSAVTESINAAVSGKADTSDVFITSSNRNSIVSNIHEEVYQLSTDDIYSISATKGQSSDTVWCQIMVDNVLYTMSGSSTSITYSDAALSSLVTADFSSNMSVTLNDRENHHINEIFFECYNNDDNSYIKEITIVHNPPIGANKIDYVAGIYTEFVHDKYAHKIDLNNKQDTLVSGTNIKTINNQSLLGSGNITIEGGTIDTTITSSSTNAVTSAAIYNQFGGLKLQKITQSAYDALVTKDANTLYVING